MGLGSAAQWPGDLGPSGLEELSGPCGGAENGDAAQEVKQGGQKGCRHGDHILTLVCGVRPQTLQK